MMGNGGGIIVFFFAMGGRLLVWLGLLYSVLVLDEFFGLDGLLIGVR